jgi:hypothetical protein
MQRAALVIPLVLLVGCREYNPESCRNPDNAGVPPCGMIPDGPPIDLSCRDDTGCTNPDQPVCTITNNVGVCVECTPERAAKCSAATPICTTNKCARCTRHSDCMGSNVCKPDGSCALETEVAYVDGAMGTNQMMCSKTSPCKKIEDAAMTGRIVKVSGTVTDRTTLNNRNALILGDPGATLALSMDEVALEVRGSSQVEIYDLVITHTGTPPPAREGVTVADTADLRMTRVRLIGNNADGARVTGGNLRCTRCTIAQNASNGINAQGTQAQPAAITISQSTIENNTGGGIAIGPNTSFQIVGNVLYHNGSPSSLTGGISVGRMIGSPANRLDFNSISRNETIAGVAPGIDCESVGTSLTARYNIIWNNGAPPQFTDQDQVNSGGIEACAHMSSDIGPLPDPPSAGNVKLEPDFMSENNGDLHLRQSKAPLSVNPSTNELTGLAEFDIDDQPRGTGGTDMGADHVPRTP